MAYQSGKTYYIVPLANQNLALNLAGVTSITNNRNVNIYTKDNSIDQRWVVRVYDGYAHILCAGNTNYGLDYYYGSNNPGNCDIYQITGNTEDSKINFRTVNASENIYRIQCYRNNADNNLYLTASSLSAGADVRWSALDYSKDNFQKWKLIEVDSSTSASYQWPTESHSLSRGFNLPDITDATDTVNTHNGIDIRATTPGVAGDAVRAFADGVVSRVKYNQSGNSEGYTVRIKHGNSINPNAYYETRYLHMQPNINVSEGQAVSKGQIIGYMGDSDGGTNIVSGVHLHFEIAARNISSGDFPASGGHYYNSVDYWVDPLTYLN